MTNRLQAVAVTFASTALAACGAGGAGMLASAPPPVATAPVPVSSPTPAPAPTLVSTELAKTPLEGYTVLAEGSYPAFAVAYRRDQGSRADNASGRETIEALDSTAVRLTAGANRAYTVELAVVGLPGQTTFDLGHETQLRSSGLDYVSDFGRRVVQVNRYSDGSTRSIETVGVEGDGRIAPRETSPGAAESFFLVLSLGDPDVVGQDRRYTSLGSWSRTTYYATAEGLSTDRSSPYDQVSFVAGRRTEPGELPITGTASYSARVAGVQLQGQNLGGAIRIEAMDLTADFGARSISATIAVPFEADDGCCGATLGITASGRAMIEQTGDYRIPLSGTTNLAGASTNPLGGSLLGAFFGPAAEETGGLIELQQNGATVFGGSYAGARVGR